MTTYNTGNPVPSAAAKDLYDNAENLDVAINGDSPTWVDRRGRTRASVSGAVAEIEKAVVTSKIKLREALDDVDRTATAMLEQTQSDANLVLASLGYLVPVAYASGIDVNSARVTVSYGGDTYAAVADQVPFVTTEEFEPSKWRVIQGVTAADLADPSVGGRMVNHRDLDVRSAIDSVLAVAVDSIADIPGALLKPGGLAVFKETVFKVGSAPRTSVYPKISAGVGLFAVPFEHHVSANFGTKAPRGSISSADWVEAGGRQLQGIEFDNRASTVVLASLNTVASTPVATLIEYEYGPAGVGTEIMRTGDIAIGHAEYFALDYAGGQRYIWSGSSLGSRIQRWPFTAGVTSPDLTVDLGAHAVGDVSVWASDHQSVCVRFVRADSGVDTVHICRLIDLSAGSFAPIEGFPVSRLSGLWPILPTQMVRAVGDVMVGLAGYMPTDQYRATAAWADSKTGRVLAQVPMTFAGAAVNDEIEGVGFFWNGEKFETVAAVWRPAGSVIFLSLSDPRAEVRFGSQAGPFYGETYNANAIGMASQQDGLSRRFKSPAPISATAVFVGGENRSANQSFNPDDFFLEQFRNDPTREGARVRLWNLMELKWDGSRDSAFPPGLRYYVDSVAPTSFHAVAGGMRAGGQYTRGFVGGYGAVHATGNATRPIGGQFSSFSAAHPAVLVQASLDIAAPTGETLTLGFFNTSTGAGAGIVGLEPAAWRPTGDAVTDLGTAALRWANVRAGNGAIVTSDARLKNSARDITEAEEAAFRAIGRLPCVWQWLARIEEEGHEARLHSGPTVQAAIDVMASNGLDWTRYSAFCLDEWDASPAKFIEVEAVINDEGVEIAPAKQVQTVDAVDAGSLFSFRREELLWWVLRAEIRYNERAMTDLQDEVEAIKAVLHLS